jgi:hypothetical protein
MAYFLIVDSNECNNGIKTGTGFNQTNSYYHLLSNKDVPIYLKYGICIYDAELPNNPKIKVYIDVNGHGIHSNMVTLSNKRKLFSVETAEFLGLNPEDMIIFACYHGLIDFIKEIKLIKYPSIAITWAAINGHLHILEYLKSQKCSFKLPGLIDQIASNGQVEVLDWKRSNRLPF